MGDSIVFTNEKCEGCNRCISTCPAILANYTVEEDGKSIIQVDGEACVQCGACFDSCNHEAREFRDDTDAFFEDLAKGKNFPLSWRLRFWPIIPGNMQEC